eukprot:Sspe_Gene.38104::Locus_18376_Transcript_1_1_Confidence_1.000_Length_831::g.38104::m.38104/K09584/PDIA6, TXNDC7; protein disulfide-isomerase A6
MWGLRVGVLLVVACGVYSVSARTYDFGKYKTCKDCVAAGFGWCPIRRLCGGFANQECGEGPRYHTADYEEGASSEEKGDEQEEEVKPKKKGKKKGKGKGKKVRAIDLPDVIPLSSKNFTKVTDTDSLWVVQFCSKSDDACREAFSPFDVAAKTLRGVVRFGHVDTAEHTDLASRYGIPSTPTIKAFFVDKDAPETYSSEVKADPLMTWVFRRVERIIQGRRRKMDLP